MPKVALIPGDGIGVEVMHEARRLLEALNAREDLGLELVDWDLGAERYLREGVTITDEEFTALAEYDAVFLGALGDPRVPGNEHTKDILLGMRLKLDLYVNFRPCVLLSPELSPLRDLAGPLRLEMFRENTEGAYTGMGGSFKTGTRDEVAIEEDVNTRTGVERIIRAAFEFADSRRRGRVTLVDKANVQTYAGGLWRRVFAEVGTGYPDIDAGRDICRCHGHGSRAATGALRNHRDVESLRRYCERSRRGSHGRAGFGSFGQYPFRTQRAVRARARICSGHCGHGDG